MKSLSFFDNLRYINGSSLYLSKYVIFIHDNPHLAELFNIRSRRSASGGKKLELGRGLIFMESNPKLCLGGVRDFVGNITFLSVSYTYDDLVETQNISKYTNGNKGVCESRALNVTVNAETAETAYVEYDRLPGDYDDRTVLYYTIAWRHVRADEKLNEVSYFDEADACGSSNLWHSIDREPQFNSELDQYDRQNATIEGLEPYTSYAVVVMCKTTTSVTGHGGPVIFITHGSNPGNVRQLRAEALSADEIRISWLPPLLLNGNLTGYAVEYRPVRTYKEDFDHSNFCNATVAGDGVSAVASTAAVASSPGGGGIARNMTENGVVIDEDELEEENEAAPSMTHTIVHDTNYAANHESPASGDSSGSMLLGSLNGVPCCSCSAPNAAAGSAVGTGASSFDGDSYSAIADESGLTAEDAREQHIEFTNAIIDSIYLPEHRRCDWKKNVKQWWYYVNNNLDLDEFDGTRFKRSLPARPVAENTPASSLPVRSNSALPPVLSRPKRQHDVIYPDGSEVAPVPELTEKSSWAEIEAYHNYITRFEPKYSKKYQQMKHRNQIEMDSVVIGEYYLDNPALRIHPTSQLASVTIGNLNYFTHYKVYVYALVKDSYGADFSLDPVKEENLNMPSVTLRTQRNETADDIDPDSFELIQDISNDSYVFLRWQEPPNPNGNMTTKFEVEVRHEHYSPNYECVSMDTYSALVGHYYTNVSATTTAATSTSTAIAPVTKNATADVHEKEKLYVLAVDVPPGIPIGGLKPGHFTFRVRAISPAGAGAWTSVRTLFIEEPGFGFATFGNTWALPLIIVFACLTGLAIPSVAAVYFWRRSHKQPPLPANMNVSVNPDYEWEHAFVYEPDEWEVDRESVKLIREVGKGSFGLVYEGAVSLDEIDTPPFTLHPELFADAAETNNIVDADDKSSARTLRCAVKTVGEAATPFERYEFLHEAGHMKKFACSHIVSLLGVVSKGQPVLVLMEYMARGDLRTWLRTRRPTVEEPDTQPPTMRQVLKMAAEIADGMMYLAVHKFVHRDLAARNCLVAEDLTVKLGDFGMTRDIYQDDYYRKSGRGMLPVRWMAPESLCDGVYTSKSDVWSFGVVLWEMATLGAQPYQGLSNEQTLTFVRDKGIMGKPEGCPEQLFDLMQMCWRYLPADRPSFARIIEMLLPDLPDAFYDVSFYRLRRVEAQSKVGSANSTSRIDLEAPTLTDEDREEMDALLEDDAEGERKDDAGPHAFKFLNSFLDEGPQPEQQQLPDNQVVDEHLPVEMSGVDDIQLQLLPLKSANDVRVVADRSGYNQEETNAAANGSLNLLNNNFAAPNGNNRSFNTGAGNAGNLRSAGGDNGYTSVMRAVTPTSAHSRAASIVAGELPFSSARSEYDPIVATLPSVHAVMPTTTSNFTDANAQSSFACQQQQTQRAKFFACPLPPMPMDDVMPLLDSTNTAGSQQPRSTPPLGIPSPSAKAASGGAALLSAIATNTNGRGRVSSNATTSSHNSDTADANSNITTMTRVENELDDSSTRKAEPTSAFLGLPAKKQRNSQSATLGAKPLASTGDILYSDSTASVEPYDRGSGLLDHRSHSEALLMVMRANPGRSDTPINHRHGSNSDRQTLPQPNGGIPRGSHPLDTDKTKEPYNSSVSGGGA